MYIKIWKTWGKIHENWTESENRTIMCTRLYIRVEILHSPILKYDALLTVDCDGLSIHSLFLFKTTLKFKANNNMKCVQDKKNL